MSVLVIGGGFFQMGWGGGGGSGGGGEPGSGGGGGWGAAGGGGRGGGGEGGKRERESQSLAEASDRASRARRFATSAGASDRTRYSSARSPRSVGRGGAAGA